jgi:hypothetical protein
MQTRHTAAKHVPKLHEVKHAERDLRDCRALLDLRGRIPVAFACERHEQGFRELRLELDSIIAHCQNTPIGFRLFGILITPNLVAGALYSTLIALISVGASKAAK